MKEISFHCQTKVYKNCVNTGKILIITIINDYWMRFRDIQNNQGRGKSYQPKPKAEVGCVYFFFAASKTWFCLLKNLPFCPVLA